MHVHRTARHLVFLPGIEKNNHMSRSISLSAGPFADISPGSAGPFMTVRGAAAECLEHIFMDDRGFLAGPPRPGASRGGDGFHRRGRLTPRIPLLLTVCLIPLSPCASARGEGGRFAYLPTNHII